MEAQKPKQNHAIGHVLYAAALFLLFAGMTFLGWVVAPASLIVPIVFVICGVPMCDEMVSVFIFGLCWACWTILGIVRPWWGLDTPDIPQMWVEFWRNPSGCDREDENNPHFNRDAILLWAGILVVILLIVLALIFDLPLPECDEDYY